MQDQIYEYEDSDIEQDDSSIIPQQIIDSNKENEILQQWTEAVDADNESILYKNLCNITLIGQLIFQIRKNNGKIFQQDLIQRIESIVQLLYKSDGKTKYKGAAYKIIIGGLTSTKLFKKIGQNEWSIDEIEAEIQIKEIIKRLKKRNNLQLFKQVLLQIANILLKQENLIPKQQQNNYKRCNKRSVEKYQTVIRSLDVIKQNMIENGLKMAQNPFKGFKQSFTTNELLEKLDSKEIIPIIKCFEYFRPLIIDGFNKLIDKKGQLDQNVLYKKVKIH